MKAICFRLLITGPLAVLALALNPSTSSAQTGEDALRFAERAPATGARLMGMGGVGIAGVGDYSAFFTNPAGLGYIGSSQFAGALTSLAATDESRYQTSGFTTFGEGDLRSTYLGNLAYLYKVPTAQGALVLGAAYNQINTFDRNLRFGGPNATNSISDSFLPYPDEFEVVTSNGNPQPEFSNDIPELAYFGGAIEFLSENVGTDEPLFYQAVAPGTTIEQFGDVLEEGRMNELSVGGAWEAAQNVMVGASANFSFGTYQFNSRFEEDDANNENGVNDYVVILDSGELRGFDFLRYDQGFESDLTGINIRAGVSGEIAEGIRLGFTAETPTYYNVSETYSRAIETFFDEGGSLDDAQSGEFEYEIYTPWRLGGGVAWRNNDIFVSGDLEYVDWSQLELDSDHTSFDEANRTIRENLDPVWNARLGAEYQFGSLAVRGGLAWQPDPRSFEIEHDGNETDRSKTFFSAGLGYQFAERFLIDVAWMQERFDDLYAPYGDVATTPPVAEEELVRNRFSLGVRVLF
jgi:hypothetical protein